MNRKPMRLKNASEPMRFSQTDTQVQTELITPIIRTGVNPFDGSENKYDPNYVITRAAVDYLAETKVHDPSGVVVGERRETLTNIFYNRAYSLFYSSLEIVDNNCRIQLNEAIPSKFRDCQDEYGYYSGSWFSFNNIMDSYRRGINGLDRKYPDINNQRQCIKLMDLTYYVQLPEDSIYECILDYASFAAANNTRNIMSMNLTAEEYNIVQQILLMGTIDAISVMESIVSVLHKEAISLYKLGYNGKSAIDFKSAQRVTQNAIVDSSYEITKSVCLSEDLGRSEEF